MILGIQFLTVLLPWAHWSWSRCVVLALAVLVLMKIFISLPLYTFSFLAVHKTDRKESAEDHETSSINMDRKDLSPVGFMQWTIGDFLFIFIF